MSRPGSDRLKYDTTTILTDGTPTVTYFVATRWVADLVVDATTDKGATLLITPCLSRTDDTALGDPSDLTTIADSGDSARVIYSSIAAERAKITLTKTEAGSSSAILLSVRGTRE